MPWGISRQGTRAEVLEKIDMLRDSAKANSDPTEQAMVDVAAEMIRSALTLSGSPRNLQTGGRELHSTADQYRVSVNASGHVDEQGGTNLYMSVQSQPVNAVGSLASGPTPNEVEAANAVQRMKQIQAAQAGTPNPPQPGTAAPERPAAPPPPAVPPGTPHP